MRPEPSLRILREQEQRSEGGFALVLVVIFTVLLVTIVTELITTAKMARLTGENDALMARMRNHMSYVINQAEEGLKDDLTSSQASAGAQGQGGGALPGGAGPGGQGGEQQGNVDSSQDSWYEPASFGENELTTYVWVEDENRKFNILSLASPEEDFARESKERFVRLIDALREETEYDLSTSDGERIARAIVDWLQGNGRNEALPKPPLKSDDEQRRQYSAPEQLEELLLLQGIDEDVFFDKVIDGKLVPGLDSVLTVYTALTFDPGDPQKLAQQQPRSGSGQGAAPAQQPGQSGRSPQQTPPPGNQGSGTGVPKPPPQPTGIGIKININTATRPVLRSLLSTSDLPDAVLDAILRYRNEEAPEEDPTANGGTGQGGGSTQAPTSYSQGNYSGDIAAGTKKKRKIFETPEDLEKVPEFQNLPNALAKQKLYALVTTESDVFSIHMASLYKRNEKLRTFVLKRSRSVEVRIDDGGQVVLHPLVLLEERKGLRVAPVDFPEDDARLRQELTEMDQYSAEEREWNPFYLDFYKARSEGR